MKQTASALHGGAMVKIVSGGVLQSLVEEPEAEINEPDRNLRSVAIERKPKPASDTEAVKWVWANGVTLASVYRAIGLATALCRHLKYAAKGSGLNSVHRALTQYSADEYV